MSATAAEDQLPHWETGAFPPGAHPLEPWLDRVPDRRPLRLANAIAGDLLAALPPERGPHPVELLPNLVRTAEAKGGPVVLHPQHESTAAESVEWMDSVGMTTAW